MKATLRLFLLMLLLATGCGATPPLLQEKSLRVRTATPAPLTVARLNPAAADEPFDPQRPDLHGEKVLATKTVTDPAAAARIRRVLDSPETFDGPAHRPCFLPRLVVRDGDGERATDYVVCVQCGRIDVYAPGAAVKSHALGSDASDFFEHLAAELFPEIRSTATTRKR